MQHLDEGTIHAWLDHALDANESVRIERHIAECVSCASAVAEARGLIAGASRVLSALDTVSGNVVPAQTTTPPARQPLWRWLRLSPARAALAASLLVAAATLLSVRHKATDGVELRTETSLAKDSARPVASAPVAAAATASNKKASVASATPTADEGQLRRRANEPAVAKQTAQAPSRAAANAGAVAADQPAVAAKAELARSQVAADKVAAAAPPAVPASAPVAQARVAPADVRVDSMRAAERREVAGGAGRGGAVAAGGRAAGRVAGFADARQVNQLQEVVMTSAGAADSIVGCYQVAPDSVRDAQARRAFVIPNRFALQQLADTSGAAVRNVVRAVTPDGRIDSVMTGSRWERISTNVANIVWMPAGGPSQATMLRFTSAGASVVVPSLAQSAGGSPITIARTTCRP